MRLYAPPECDARDGYPPEWHETIKHAVRAEADHRCVRCGHPYRNGEHGNGEWSRCDERCAHGGPLRKVGDGYGSDRIYDPVTAAGVLVAWGNVIEAQWRVLTVHHLDANKANCRWWNLVALDQRCHLRIQGKVQMARVWPWEHSAWFRPYVAGYYAWVYLREDLSRAEVEARMDELLALERQACLLGGVA